MKKILILLTICLTVAGSCMRLDPRPQKFDRTVLLYMACDGNGLRYYAEGDIDLIVRGYMPERSDRNEALLVFLDNGAEAPRLLRYYSTSTGAAYKEMVKQYGSDFNSADADCLNMLLQDVDRLFPSDHRGLLLWSHGTGWLPDGYYADPRESLLATKSFAQENGHEMDIKDLSDALTGHFEFILFDCCLMGTVEVAYQLRDKADYIIASSAEILADGFPYETIMPHLFYDHSRGIAGLKAICDEYYDYYNAQTGVSRTATVALIDCGHLEELAAACRPIYANHQAERAAVQPSSVQRFYSGDKHWFYDLDDYLVKFASPAEYAAFTSALDRCIPCKHTTDKILGVVDVRTFCGLSTYIPIEDAAYLNQYYKTLDWTIDTSAL